MSELLTTTESFLAGCWGSRLKLSGLWSETLHLPRPIPVPFTIHSIVSFRYRTPKEFIVNTADWS